MAKRYVVELVFGNDKKQDFDSLETKEARKEFLKEYKQTYSFKSQAELDAFQKGVEETVGYMEAYETADFKV